MADFSSDQNSKQVNIRLTEDEYFILQFISKRWYGKPNVSKLIRFIIKSYTKEAIKYDNK